MPEIDLKLAASIAVLVIGLLTAGGSLALDKARAVWRNWRGSDGDTTTAPAGVSEYVTAVREWSGDAPADVVLGYIASGLDEVGVLRSEMIRRTGGSLI